MFSVFLVEDEVVVRESIKKNVDWESYGFMLAGEAGDGELAYAQIKEKQPDLLITDIKMPFMDGIELSRLVAREMPDTKIVFLTGYGEFEYAREAIRLNAAEYLLKPVTENALGEMLERVFEILQAEHKQKTLIEQYMCEMQEMKELDRERFMNALIGGKHSVNDLLDMARKLDIPISAASYTLILMRVFQPEDMPGAYSEKLVEYSDWVRAFFNQQKVLLFPYRPDNMAVLVKTGEGQDAQEICHEVACRLAEKAGEQGLCYFVACGSTVSRLGDLSKAYRSANKAFSYRYMLEGSHSVFYEQLNSVSTSKHLYPDLEGLGNINIDKKIIDKLLRSGTQSDVRYVIDEYFDRVGQKHLDSWMLRQYLAMDIQLTCLSYLDELGIGKTKLYERCAGMKTIDDQIATVETTQAYLVDILEQTLSLCESHAKGRYDQTIMEAKDFIAKYYSNEETSLNNVAKAVNMSPTHFSTIFKQETGQTFIEFLTEIRMEKARELLRKTSDKTSAIAYIVGYKDPHYFSYLFKKINGVSPKEYRNA